MIDTIRFRGDFLSLEHLPKIEFELETLIKTKGDVTLFQFTSGQLSGSYDNRISFSIKDKDWVYNEKLGRPEFLTTKPFFVCELSLHKFFLGHNVYGFDDDLSRIYAVYDFLEASFGCEFIDHKTVELLRIDLAEVYKFNSKEEVKAVFHGLKNHRRYRTKPSTYKDTGIYYPGTMTTFKVYDKHEEFKAHDYKRLKKMYQDNSKNNGDYWYHEKNLNDLLEKSKNVVRLECEIHKKKLNELYGRYVFVEELIMNKIIDLKTVYLKEKNRLIFETKDELALKCVADVHLKLISEFGARKANPIYAFWTSMTMQGEEWTRNIYSHASFYRNKKILKDLGIPFYEYGFTVEELEKNQDCLKTDISSIVELFNNKYLLRDVI